MVEMDVLPCKNGLHSLKIVWLVSTSAGRRQRRRVPRLHRRTPPYHRPHCSASVPHVPRGFAIPTATPSGSDKGSSTRSRVHPQALPQGAGTPGVYLISAMSGRVLSTVRRPESGTMTGRT